MRPPTSGDDAHRLIVVLLIDDQAFVGAAVGRLLATEGDINYSFCQNPLAALAVANTLQPTIILQDLVMPGVDGLNLLRSFRSNPGTAKIPIIVLSGNDDADTRVRALAEGASDYLVKLPTKNELIACIRRHAAADPQPDTRARGQERAADTPRPAAHQTLDRSVLAALREGDVPGYPSFTRTLIDTFVRDADSQMQLLKDAARRSDHQTIQQIAHSLKGSSMTMGANRFGALCAWLEGRPAGAADTIVAALERELILVKDALAGE